MSRFPKMVSFGEGGINDRSSEVAFEDILGNDDEEVVVEVAKDEIEFDGPERDSHDVTVTTSFVYQTQGIQIPAHWQSASA